MSLNPVLPNRAIESDIRDYFIERGTAALKRLAGYQAKLLPDAVLQTVLAPLEDVYTRHTDIIMSELCGQSVVGCNPRSPFLVIMWMWLSEDNNYNMVKIAKPSDMMEGAKSFFQIIFDELRDDELREVPEDSDQEVIRSVRQFVDDTAKDIAIHKIKPYDFPEGTRKRAELKVMDTVKEAYQAKAIQWAHLTDKEILDACVPIAWTVYKYAQKHFKESWVIDGGRFDT